MFIYFLFPIRWCRLYLTWFRFKFDRFINYPQWTQIWVNPFWLPRATMTISFPRISTDRSERDKNTYSKRTIKSQLNLSTWDFKNSTEDKVQLGKSKRTIFVRNCNIFRAFCKMQKIGSYCKGRNWTTCTRKTSNSFNRTKNTKNSWILSSRTIKLLSYKYKDGRAIEKPTLQNLIPFTNWRKTWIYKFHRRTASSRTNRPKSETLKKGFLSSSSKSKNYRPILPKNKETIKNFLIKSELIFNPFCKLKI